MNQMCQVDQINELINNNNNNNTQLVINWVNEVSWGNEIARWMRCTMWVMCWVNVSWVNEIARCMIRTRWMRRVRSGLLVQLVKRSSKTLLVVWESLTSNFMSRWWQVGSFDKKLTFNRHCGLKELQHACDKTGCKIRVLVQCQVYITSHVHRAYEYSGSFEVCWVHMT